MCPMINIFPQNSIHIHKAKNGFIVKVKGSREDQEDNLDKIYVYGNIRELNRFIRNHYNKIMNEVTNEE